MSVSMAKLGWRLAAILLVAGWALQSRAEAAEVPEEQAKAILDSSGVTGGLVVHVGCGDGRLTAALGASPRLVVHGLDTDVNEARRTIRAAGLYGPVSVDHLDGERLPYVDNLVRLLVVTGDSQRIPRNEVLRVLCPGGVAMVAGSKIVKPWPDEIDEWTHYLHGPDNNAVAKDTVVGPPQHFQWISGPRFSRSHDHLASVSAVVSAGGRIFYIADFGSIGYVGARGRWRLVARDAFNGVKLWEREVAPWEHHLRDFRSGPADIARRLVAVGPSAGSGQSGRVYVTLGYEQPVTALEAATGEVVRTYSETKGAREILHYEGMLLLALGEPDKNWRAEEARKTVTQKDYLPPFKTVTPPGHNMKVMAVDARTGRMLWESAEAYTQRMMPSTLAAAGGLVYFHSADAVVCLDASTGKKRWQASRPVQRKRLAWSVPTLVAHDGIVYSGDRMAAETDGEVLWIPSGGYHEYIRGPEAKGELIAFDGKTGKRLWSCPAYEGFNAPVDVLIADGLLWTGRYAWGQDPGITEGRDPRTGEVRRRRPTDQEFLSRRIGHARCHRAKATSRYLVLGRRGVEFVDVKTGEMVANFWVRGICQYGVMPANGLLYVPPHSCACSVADMLKCGFTALAPSSKQDTGAKPAASKRLVRGPAHGAAPAAPAAAAKDAWPMYRHDAARSGATASRIPRDLKVAWTTSVGGEGAKLTSPVIAGGLLLVAEADAHRVHALDAAGGKEAWSFTAGARIDSAPTIDRGRALFGSADGWVYCLRLTDGALAWKYRAAPLDRRIVVYGQLESPWPVSGSVLVVDGAAHFAAGRTSYLDGGMLLCKLDAATGREIQVRQLVADPKKRGSGVASGGYLPDVLSSDGSSVFMRGARFDMYLGRQKDTVPHLWSSVGFLDDSWWHRTYWQIGTSMSSGWGGWSRAGQKVPAGRLLVTDGSRVFGFGRNQYDTPGAHIGVDGAGAWGPVGAGRSRWTYDCLFGRSVTVGAGKSSRRKPATPVPDPSAWSRKVPVTALGMVLAGETLFVAGAPHSVEETPMKPSEADPLAEALEARRGGRLLVVSAKDGETAATYDLKSAPVFDGMAAATGRLYLSTKSGRVVCIGPAQ